MKNIFVMKKVILLSVIGMMTVFSAMGSTRSDKRAARRAQQDSLQQVDYELAVAGIHDTLFVLEADQAFDRRGRSIMVDQSLNFVKIAKDEGVVQLSFSQLAGPNGVGGVTIEGRVSRYIVETDKKGNTSIKVNTFGSSMNAEIFITLYAGSNQAEAQVSSATLPYKVRFIGELKHAYDSDVFQGNSRF